MTSSQAKNFVERCLQERVDADKFISLATLFASKTKTSWHILLHLVIQSQILPLVGLDPLVPSYVERLVLRNQADSFTVLLIICRYGQFDVVQDSKDAVQTAEHRHHVHYELEEALLGIVAKQYTDESLTRSENDAWSTIKLLTRWVSKMATIGSESMMPEVQQEVISVHQAMGILLVSLLENHQVALSIDSNENMPVKKAFCKAMMAFIPLLAQTAEPLAAHLTAVLGMHSKLQLHDADISRTSLGAEIQLSQIVNTEPIHTRAHLLIHLDALLAGRPIVFDSDLLQYLTARFKEDHSSMSIGLATAVFDLLALQNSQNVQADRIFLTRCFLNNRLPLLLNVISSMSFTPFDQHILLTQIINRSDITSDATGLGVNVTPDWLLEAREEFLSACVVHGLTTEQDTRRMVEYGDARAASLSTRISKETIVEQYQNKSQQFDGLVSKLELMDGNAGAVVEAVTTLMDHFCSRQETSALRNLCQSLSSKPRALDCICLFEKLIPILLPLCHMIEAWKVDEDIDHHVAYEEFGACVLFLMAMVRRYRVQPLELGLRSTDGFVAKLLSGQLVERSLDQLDVEEKGRLNNWAQALFDTEAIDDELLSSCSPQQFYEIVAPLFDSCVSACSTQAVDVTQLQGGLGLFLKTLLMPSLIISLDWLGRHLWSTKRDTTITLQIIDKLTNLRGAQGEVAQMQRTVLAIMGKPLAHAVEVTRKTQPKENTVGLIERLRPHTTYPRVSEFSKAEAQSWTLGRTLRGRTTVFSVVEESLKGLAFWSLSAGSVLPTLNYSYRQLFAAIQLDGPTATVLNIIEWLREAAHFEVALDVAAALTAIYVVMPKRLNIRGDILREGSAVTAPFDTPLRSALMLEVRDAAKHVQEDPIGTEIAIRLNRRVEMLFSGPPLPDINEMHPVALEQIALPDMMQDINMDPAAAELVDASVRDIDTLEFGGAEPTNNTGLGLNLDGVMDTEATAEFDRLTSSAAAAAGVTMSMTDEDIFGGLEGLDDMDFG